MLNGKYHINMYKRWYKHVFDILNDNDDQKLNCHLPSRQVELNGVQMGPRLTENELWIHWSFRGTLGSDKLLWFWFFKTFQVLENFVLFATRKITLWLIDCLCNYTHNMPVWDTWIQNYMFGYQCVFVCVTCCRKHDIYML